MIFYEFTPEEIAAVKSHFPKLEYLSTGVWKGILEFDHIYRGYRIIDSYSIGIGVPAAYPSQFPHVTELGDRVTKAAAKYNKSVLDAHWSQQNGACLCVKQEEKIKFPPGSDMVFFIENLVIPYFYGLSYFEEHGRWPWKEYSHGVLGILERHIEDSEKHTRESLELILPAFRDNPDWRKYRAQFVEPKGNKACLCKSGKAFSECHPLGWQGMVLLHEDLKRLNLNPYKFFFKTREKS